MVGILPCNTALALTSVRNMKVNPAGFGVKIRGIQEVPFMATYKLLCCYVFTTITATAAYAQSAPDCWRQSARLENRGVQYTLGLYLVAAALKQAHRWLDRTIPVKRTVSLFVFLLLAFQLLQPPTIEAL